MINKLNAINEDKDIRNMIAHRNSLSFAALSTTSNPYSLNKAFEYRIGITTHSLYGDDNDHPIIFSEEIKNKDALKVATKIIKHERKLLDIAYTYIFNNMYPVKKKNIGAKYFLVYYRCRHCGFFSTDNPYCFVRSSILNYYPKIYNDGFCTHCHKEGPEDKFHLIEYSEFHFEYELAATRRTKIGEFYILLNWNNYYSKFISLKSNTIHNHIRENDYKNYLD